MDKLLPLDIVSLPGGTRTSTVKSPQNIHQTSRCELQIFKQAQRVGIITGERSVFDHRKPPSSTFEVADIGWEGINSRNFVPVPGIISEKGVLRNYKRPKFKGMTGYAVPPYSGS